MNADPDVEISASRGSPLANSTSFAVTRVDNNWQQTINALESGNHNYKIHQLPLADITMTTDPDVRMISAS